MKRCLFLRMAMLSCVVLVCWACSQEPDLTQPPKQEPLYSIAQARAFYDQTSVQTRAVGESGALTPGAYSLDWEHAEVSLDSLMSSVDVPIDMQYNYFRYLQPEADSVLLTPIFSKLVVVKEHPTLHEGCYIRYTIPFLTMLQEQPSFDYDGLLNSYPKSGFSGVLLYTDLDGWPLCVGYYYEGELLIDAFLVDKAHSIEENADLLCELLQELQFIRSQNVTTRGTETNQDAEKENPIDGGTIQDVVILPDWQAFLDYYQTRNEIVNMDELPQPNIGGGPDESGGNGSGSGGSSSGDGDADGNDNSSKHNENIKFEDEGTKELIEPLLDSISQDCMGKTLLESLEGVNIKTGTDHNRQNSVTNTIELKQHELYGYRDYVLMEELIHSYQSQAGYTTNSIEKEIEAKIGWMIYLAHQNRKLTPSQAKAQLGHSSLGLVALFDVYYDFKFISTDPFFDMFYQESIFYLRRFYPEEQYPYTGNHSLVSFENIIKLLLNCPPQ